MRRALDAVVALMLVLADRGPAAAEDALLPPPAGASLVLEVLADGVQIYACEAKGTGFAWAFKAPEATLVDRQDRLAGRHFAGPTWQGVDGSAVLGEVLAKADAPDATAIPWLLLRAKSHAGSGVLSNVAYIRRAATRGGLAPSTGCDAGHAASEIRIPYAAVYQFYAAPK
jgi:hypothetical protein